MANLTSNGPQPIKPMASNIFAQTDTVNSKRSAIHLLPAVYQTDTLEKFFNATIDHMLQPENVEFISGYVGSKPAYYDKNKDFYITEKTQNRTNYQLPVTAVSTDPTSSAVTNIMFYDDTINLLAFQGSNIKSHSRLLETEYYSWLPPIDPDKFINFYEYYWLPQGPGNIQLLNYTDLRNDAIGKTEYTYVGSYYRVTDNQTITGELKLSSGMRIQVSNDADHSLEGIIFIVEGVGTGIKIEPDYMSPAPGWDVPRWDVRGWDGDDINNIPDYMTLGRIAQNYNRWSVNNRWFHKDVLLTSGLNLFDKEDVKAKRPIIEFDSNMHLFNHGTYGLPDIDIVDTTTTDVFGTIAGMQIGQVSVGNTTVNGRTVNIGGRDVVLYGSNIIIDGVNLIDGMTILFTADKDSSVNNRVYQVGGIEEYGVVTLTLVTKGQNSTGAPTYGDCTYAMFGTNNGKKTWWFNGTTWVAAQTRQKYVPALFAGYDRYGNNLIDPAVYPGSNFSGNTIFTYKTDSNYVVDTYLQIKAKRDQFGDFIFDNSLVTSSYTYIENNQEVDITGYLWYSNGNISNGWHKCRGGSRQYILNSFDITESTATFLIDQSPAEDVLGFLPNIMVYQIHNHSSKLLVNGVDYTVYGRTVTLTTAVDESTAARIEIYSWSKDTPVASNGYYLQPVNLVANPNNEEINTLTFDQTIKHFGSLISNQYKETTNGAGATGWRDSAKVLGLGVHILQHRSPMLKLMMLNSSNINTGALGNTSLTDVSLAIQWAQREYTRFYSRFTRALFNLYNAQGFDKNVTPQGWIDTALQQINLGKSKTSAWAYSGYEQTEDFTSTQNPTFIPPTAAKLGITPVFAPEVYLDSDYYPPKLTLQTHDGANIILEDLHGEQLGTISSNKDKTSNPNHLSHPVAAAWLQLEINLYNAIPAEYKDIDSAPAFDQRIYKPGKWRNQLNFADSVGENYSREEYLNILRPSFDKWIITSQLDYSANATFQENNEFSWNYNSCTDKDNEPIPGNWKAIYRWFYDTDRPHTHPWEMLGFSQKPVWWESEYGPAPYTRGNTTLWEDLTAGLIRNGIRAGVHSAWARPGLMDCIPVDDQGLILPPNLAGVIAILPTLNNAQAEWKFGDGGPVEDVWINSLEHGFVTALTSYLMKPARFIEQTWDPLRTEQVGEGDSQQWLYKNTNNRRGNSEFYIHREVPTSLKITNSIPNESTLSFFGSWGIQHWISEYLINQNLSVTKNIGYVIRGSYSSLAHKFGGFVGTDNSLRVMADSFGQLGYTSQLVPSENVQTYLYRSTSLGTYFYSGVIIVKQSNGYAVYGYDGINPSFTVIPSIVTGPKSSNVIGNTTVVDYKNGAGLNTVPYGTIFDNRQDVYDFIVSYGRWLESEGWKFEIVNDESGKVVNWRQSARDFVYWSQGNWTNGNFIALSPGADLIKFKKEFGTVQCVNGTSGGTYPVLDKSGQPIEAQNLEILRFNDELTINSTNGQTIFGLRVYVTTVEHVMLVSNVTQFNDLIYDPLLNVYQPRLKVYGYRTNNWSGRLDAPGYFLYQDPITNQWKMIENFEKTSADFKNLYNIDQPKNIVKIDNNTGKLTENSSINHAVTRTDLSQLAKHTISYQKREYLENLLLDDTTQFEFFQGFIRQKGSRKSLDGILRNTSILPTGQTVNYYEEYAFRKARYGAVALNTNIDFIIPQVEYVNNPQRIDVFSNYDSTQPRDGIIEIAVRDPGIVVPPENYEGKLFPLRANVDNSLYGDLPTSGFVHLGETTYTVINQTELYNLNANLAVNGKTLTTGDTIWQFTTVNASWDVYKVVSPASTVSRTLPHGSENITEIIFNDNHGIMVDDLIVITGFKNNNSLNSTFIVEAVTDVTISIPISTFIEDFEGVVRVLKSKKFFDKNELLSYDLLGGWHQGDLVYVTNGEAEGEWTVYRWNIGTWEIYRNAEPKVDANLILSSRLYNKLTFADATVLEYYDPGKGMIPGIADKEITYKTVYDPAQYNSGDTSVYSLNEAECWSEPHVGEVWWDLGTTRFVDYETGPIDYRVKNWAKLAPGTDIEIYEWVKSSIPPADWTNYTITGVNLSKYGIPYIASGFVRNSSNPAWTQKVEYDSNGIARTWYYFWVGRSDMPPLAENRNLSTNEIARIIKNPGSNAIPWFAAVSERTLIVANIGEFLTDTDIVMQVNYTTKPNDANDYKEWTLIRKDDPNSYIDQEYWNKLRDSLTGFDAMGNQVPDPQLNELLKYGNLIRPRQSWFADRLEALSIWANRVNTQLADASDPLVLDSSKSTWSLYFTQSEPIPSAYGNYEYKINDMSEMSIIKQSAIDGERVFVMPTAVNNNMWTIWQWDAASNDFVLYRKQAYNVNNYWKYVDWYSNGYDSNTIPTYTVDTVKEKDAIITAGVVVKVRDFDGRWALFLGLETTGSILVGLQDGTIQITENLWNTTQNQSGFDLIGFDTKVPFDYNPTMEIGLIFDGVVKGIYNGSGSTELNELFFAMVNFVFNEHNYVDWVFKTSFISINGSMEPLSTSELYKPNTVDLLLDYLNEAKPYRTKIREFVSSRTAVDNVSVKGSTDFDKPVYLETEDNSYRVLSELNITDQNIMISSSTYSPWFNNYKTNPNLIRRLKTQLVFDRVASMPQVATVVNASANGSTVSFTIKPSKLVSTFRVGEKIYVTNVQSLTNQVTIFNTSDAVVASASDNVIVTKYNRNLDTNFGTKGEIYHQYSKSLSITNAKSSGNTVVFSVDLNNEQNTFRVGEKVTIGNVTLVSNTTPFTSFTTSNAIVLETSGNLVTVDYTSNIGIANGISGNIFHQYNSFVSVVNVESRGDVVIFTTAENITNIFIAGETVTVGNVIARSTMVQSFASNDVTITAISGDIIFGKYNRTVGIGTGYGGAIYHQTFGAADRIMRDYAPTQYMPPAFSPDLISGTDYKGIIYSGGPFEAGWDMPAGFSPDDAAVNDAQEVMLEGGLPPIYDQFYGNGHRTLFRLSRVPQNLVDTKIWKDKSLAVYGEDYTIPTYATSIKIIERGKGYSPGEKLKVVGNAPGGIVVPTEFVVTGVDSNGGIKNVIMLNAGSFEVIQDGAYSIEYIDSYYVGSGKNAKVGMIWGGSTLKFTTPPTSSDKPNIWVLYAGTTFEPAPAGEYDIITDGSDFINPTVEADHAEELLTNRIRDAVRIDTYSNYVGGMPIVWQTSYITEGIKDHYSMGVRPQNDSGVEAYLDGVLLRYGPTKDFVVNFETGELVFVYPPDPGKRLTIIAYGDGGSGSTISAVYPVSRGENYKPGDFITLEGGEPTQFNDAGGKYRARVQVETVTAGNIHIANGGTGYKTGEILQLVWDLAQPGEVQTPLLVKTTNVTIKGSIVSVEIYNAGSYKTIPDVATWKSSNSNGSGLNMSPVWGVNTAKIDRPGLYTVKPTVPFVQYASSTSGGTGATFNAYYTSIINQETFVATGKTGTFTLRKSGTSFFNFMVTVNGVFATVLGYSSTSVSIATPPLGSYVVVTVFNTPQFSKILNEEFTYTGFSYIMERPVGNTVPDYSTVVVTADGLPLSPPPMKTYIGDGYTRQFDFPDVPTDPETYLKVYIDGAHIGPPGYDVFDGTVTLYFTLNEGATLTIVNMDPTQGQFYSIIGKEIFMNNVDIGARINVLSFTQDLSYRFVLQEFDGNPNGEYILEDNPTSESTITVFKNNQLQRMLWDYAIARRTIEGFDIFGYDAQPFDSGPYRYVILFNQPHDPADNITIRYMRGAPERPGIAIRQFIDSSLYRQSYAIDFKARTRLLSEVLINSSSIEVEDYTKLTQPTLTVPGSVWIDNEKIDFLEVQPAPTRDHPNRAFLTNIVRGAGGTSTGIETTFNIEYFDGNGTTDRYATMSGYSPNGITVYVNNKFQAQGKMYYYAVEGMDVQIGLVDALQSTTQLTVYDTYPNSEPLTLGIDYYFMSNNSIRLINNYETITIITIKIAPLPGVKTNCFLTSIEGDVSLILNIDAGVYIIFDSNSIPPVGYKNIKFVEVIGSTTSICHFSNVIVQDSGTNMLIPGGYNWEPSPMGLQYNNSPQVKFLLEHPGARD